MEDPSTSPRFLRLGERQADPPGQLLPPMEDPSASPRFLGLGEGQADPPRQLLPRIEDPSASPRFLRLGEGQADPPGQLLPPMEDPSASPRLPIYPVVPQIDFPRHENTRHSQSNQLELEPIATVQSKRMGQWSPGSSPHKLGKAGPKRQRTVAVHSLHVSRVPPTDSQQSCNPPQNMCTEASTSTLTLQGFQEFRGED